jgi:hypothetical protein
MSRAVKRAGFGSQVGAINGKITYGASRPRMPKKNDAHMDFERGTISLYSGTAWSELNLIYVSDTEPTNVNLLWLDIS